MLNGIVEEERAASWGLLLWREELPLGIAADAADRWHAGSKGGAIADRKAVQLLTKAVAAASGRKLDAAGGSEIEQIDLGSLEERDPANVGDDVVRAVAARLSGRAALLSEAQQLLAAGPPACRAASESRSALYAALQSAALRGQVRLRPAVAQQPAASPLRRLLPAPLRRGGCRCLRCGSGEERMNRTACEACGSSACAYCEACLTMGRSRECGLLVLGGGMECLADAQGAAGTEAAPSSAAARAHGGRAPTAPDARWGLSPAQQAAAAAALQYALPRLPAPAPASVPASHPAPSLTPSAAPQPARAHSRQPAPAPAPASQLASAFTPAPQPAPVPHPAPAPAAQPASASQLASAFTPAPHPTPVPHPAPAPAAQPAPASQPALASAQHARLAVTPRVVEPFLLWAVTGAGKTEMIFPLIEAALTSGGRALIATPRRDVVLELDPRIRRAFPNATVVTLYGGSEQRWDDGDIMLATTHQLFRFHEHFNLVVIDELDAFPYQGDPRLQYAAAKASVPGGAVILLTATPSRELQLAARRGQLSHVRVPVRFHRRPLPVPVYVSVPRTDRLMARRRLPDALLSRLRSSIDRGAQCFIFVERIRHVQPVADMLRAALPGIPVGSTSSKDAERSHHVQLFRDRQLRVLVTTTILERGVTVPRSDVFILDADAALFDEASLVQMAGRAGRSIDDPDGKVYYCAPVRSRSQQRAIKQIRSMNKEAAVKGFI